MKGDQTDAVADWDLEDDEPVPEEAELEPEGVEERSTDLLGALFGVTSDFPMKVAPSSMIMRMALRSPVSCELALSSQRSETVMLPVTVP